MLYGRAEGPRDDVDGFTLIELLVVMLIIGILAAIAVPLFLRQREGGYEAVTKSDVRNGVMAEETFFTNSDPNSYTDNTATNGLLPGWTKSSHTTSVVFSFSGDSFKIDGTSRTGRHFCFNRANAGAGVVDNGTNTCP